jgi:hypothetical protein
MFPRPAFVFVLAAAVIAAAAPALAINTPAEDAKDAARLEAARANAGEPVQTVRFLRPVDSYEVVGASSILVWETNTKAWLVDVRPGASCQARDLDQGWAIGLEAAYDTMNTRNGFVVGRHGMRCRITEIREVNVPAMRAAERATEATEATAKG